ncbi:Uncharacterised protein [Salmonella enterica subsp. enterica serovar Typhi]|nr:Uncharacterised protein [Salmonella enterica subsp. enterica serovar Typhi]
MTIVKTHTGTVITKDGPQVKKLHQTERMWVVGKNEFYHPACVPGYAVAGSQSAPGEKNCALY